MPFDFLFILLRLSRFSRLRVHRTQHAIFDRYQRQWLLSKAYQALSREKLELLEPLHLHDDLQIQAALLGFLVALQALLVPSSLGEYLLGHHDERLSRRIGS